MRAPASPAQELNNPVDHQPDHDQLDGDLPPGNALDLAEKLRESKSFEGIGALGNKARCNSVRPRARPRQY